MADYYGCPRCAATVKRGEAVCAKCGYELTRAAPPPASQATAPAGPMIACEKCKAGAMQATKVPRFSPGLRLIGFTLWIPALILLALGTVFMLGTMGAGGAATIEITKEAKQQAVDRMREGNVPGSLVADFAEDGSVTDTELARLTPEQRERRRQRDQHLSGYGGRNRDREGLATGASGCGLVGLYFVLVPTFIVGLLLTLTKEGVALRDMLLRVRPRVMRTLLSTLWTLRRDSHHVAAELHFVEAAQGYELVFTWNGQVQETHLRRGEGGAHQVREIAETKRVELESRGWRG